MEENVASNLQIKSKIPKLYSLPNVDEGLIGKIIRYRSGKTKFLLGDAAYEITRGASSDFISNVVLIESRAEERSTNIYNFGPIKSKFVCSPDWNWLFQKISEWKLFLIINFLYFILCVYFSISWAGPENFSPFEFIL